MSSLIRFNNLNDAVAIRPLDVAPPATSPGAESADPLGLFARDPELLRRDQEIAALREALDEADSRQTKAVAAAREQGRLDAEAAYRRKDELALAALKDSAAAAVRQLEDNLVAASQLALLLAETALAKVFARPKNQTELVAQAIERQVEALRAETVVRLHVSPTDFADQTALDALARSVAARRLEVDRDPQLASGSCRIDLRLGHVELSLSQHWQALKALFNRLSDQGGAA